MRCHKEPWVKHLFLWARDVIGSWCLFQFPAGSFTRFSTNPSFSYCPRKQFKCLSLTENDGAIKSLVLFNIISLLHLSEFLSNLNGVCSVIKISYLRTVKVRPVCLIVLFILKYVFRRPLPQPFLSKVLPQLLETFLAITSVWQHLLLSGQRGRGCLLP